MKIFTIVLSISRKIYGWIFREMGIGGDENHLLFSRLNFCGHGNQPVDDVQ